MPAIQLQWKSFQVNLSKVSTYLKTNLSSNYDGLVCDQNFLNVMFTTDISDTDSGIISTYWNTATAQMFQPTIQEILTVKISDAMNFGNNLIVQASVENITMGITQAGKTKVVSDYLDNMQTYLKAGSLYAAVDELNLLLAQDIPTNVAPYVTAARLTNYKNQIQTYLGLPLT